MSSLTAEQRQEIRDALDQSRREALEQSKARAAMPKPQRIKLPKSPVVRAARVAQRAQEATTIARELFEERKPTGRCQFCGAPARNSDVCRAHGDLV